MRINGNQVGVLPTDTLYGLVGRALSKKAVQRIYQIKGRSRRKPLIILISSKNDLKLFGVKLDKATDNLLNKLWPGPVSVILPLSTRAGGRQDTRWRYLHRGTRTLAFRLPKKKPLIRLLKKTGPLVAPSANPEGRKPAATIAQAKKYFGAKVDFYVSAGRLLSPPSTLIKIIR